MVYYISLVFAHSSVDRHLGYLYILAIVNIAVMSIGVHVMYLFKLVGMYFSDIYKQDWDC